MKTSPGSPPGDLSGDASAETPQALFERISRRRAARRDEAHPAHGSAPPESGKAAGHPEPGSSGAVRIDEILPATPSRDQAAPILDEPQALPSPGQPAQARAATADSFPRSATMRLLLKHPELALGVALPTAGLLLAHPASRR